MCELLGLCFNVEVPVETIGRAFRVLGNDNPHGWGVGFYNNGKLIIAKEPKRVTKSSLYEYLLLNRKVYSKMFVIHVRKASKGEVTYENTHPFTQKLFDKEWCFAHNGTIHEVEEIKVHKFKPEGTTDSEKVFCHIIEYMKTIGFDYTEECFVQLEEKLNEINKSGDLNIIMTDGEYLFCYSDNNCHRNQLYYTERKYPFKKIKLKIDGKVEEINLNDVKSPIESGVIVVTAPKYKNKSCNNSNNQNIFEIIEGEDWKPIPIGRLYVFKDGVKIYP